MTAKTVQPITMHVVPALGDGTPLITGDLELPPLNPDAEGWYVVQVDDVKRALVAWLREAADELEQVLDTEIAGGAS